jgi:hypothetical protein
MMTHNRGRWRFRCSIGLVGRVAAYIAFACTGGPIRRHGAAADRVPGADARVRALHGPKGQIPAVLTIRGPARRCEWLPIVTHNVPMACPPRVRAIQCP